ncbi:SOS response-associated peptidase [Granulicella sp. L60]|uniref:SOS response-associated peptidase n=1 Tax=Granulicella sp. L60 TaxID=1641866 RepID=UPI00131EABF4|nr:SOS response-associated peptidase [Granulicella sp. L60]
MCGRYRRSSDKQTIATAFQVEAGLDEVYLGPEDDIAPGSVQPVILLNDHGERVVEQMRWGFKLPDRLLFVARSEEILEKPFWKDRFAQRRVIVPADSFFDWKQVQKGAKPKYEFTVPGREPFGMAGVWSPWKNPKTGQWERTFAIVTTAPNEVMVPIKDRQPSVLEVREYAEYLERTERPPIHLFRVLPAEELRANLVGPIPEPPCEPGLFDNL